MKPALFARRCSALLLFVCAVFSPLLFSHSSFAQPLSQADEDSQPSQNQYALSQLQQAFNAYDTRGIDARMAVVDKLIAVKEGKLSAENFYKEVSALNMPDGKEVRHVLMEVKKDIGNHLGNDGLKSVFGEQYAAGGSQVEKAVLGYRKQEVLSTIDQVIKEFSGKNTIDGKTYSVFYSEVGSWSTESLEQMKFAGDIDFNFLSGNLELAMAFKKRYDQLILEKFGRTAEELDIPCTVMGMGTEEVYVGKTGQGFAEDVTKKAKRINLGDDGKPVGLGEEMEFKQALRDMLLEAKFAKTGLADLGEIKWPREPGVSLEMIRHFEHDIVKQNVYTDLESFMKAAKYADRSFSAMEKEGVDVKDKALREFVKEMIEQKASPKAQVELIKGYYEKIGKPLPFEANFEVNADGKAAATLKTNEKIIKEFWDTCRQTMWQNANMKLKSMVTDFGKKVRSLSDADQAEAKALYEELKKYHEMMEVEHRVLTDQNAGLHENVDANYTKLLSEFRDVVKEFKQKSAKNGWVDFEDPKLGNTFRFIDEELTVKSDMSPRMIGAALLSAAGKVNDVLDFFDDNLMQNLRNGPAKDYTEFLRKGRELYWSEQADQFLKGTGQEGKWTQYLNEKQQKFNELNEWFNTKLENSCAKRGVKVVQGAAGAVRGGIRQVAGGIQRINNEFNASVQASAGGQAVMQGMMVYSLATEIPVYVELVGQGDLSGFAAEFFKRRIPLGSAAERAYMGDYYGMAWETTVAVLPPLGLAAAAESIGESMAQTAWDEYWSEELDKFIDEMYENAKFEIVGVEHFGDDIKISQWRLGTVSYKGEEFDIEELLSMEIADAKEMGSCLSLPSDKRAECFPVEKMRNGLFKWLDSDDALRMNIGKSDPWLALIEEMEETKLVGPKLNDHLWYQKQTRWEQLKVKFLMHVKKLLEERRSAEQAVLSGEAPKLYNELISIASKLSIKDETIAALKEQTSTGFVGFLEGLKDELRSVKREALEEADIWDTYEENTRVLSTYLIAYKKVWEARVEGEKSLTLAHEDMGLRLLTGPYFLDADPPADEAAARQWGSLPAQTVEVMTEKLSSIKSEAAAGELDLKEGAYDRSILDRLIFHDSFREMWKHVNGRCGSLNIASILVVPAEGDQKGAAAQTDQDLALERFKYHHETVENLINGFREHYGVKKDDVLTELREMRGRASALAEEICQECGSLSAQLEEIGLIVAGIDEPFVNLEPKVKAMVKLVDKLDTIESDMLDAHKTVEGLTTNIGDDSVTEDQRKETICQVASTMADVKTNGERDALYAQATSANADVKSTFEHARSEYKTLEGISAKTKETLDQLTQAQQGLDEVTQIPADVQELKERMASEMGFAEGLLDTAQGNLEELKTLVDDAKAKSKEVEQGLKPERKTDKGQALLEELKQIMDEINGSYGRAKACPKGPSIEIKKIKSSVERMDKRYTQMEKDMLKIREAFQPDAEGNPPAVLTSALEKANLIDLLKSMGEGYVQSCTQSMLLAVNCMNRAEELQKIDVSAYVPNVVGMICQDGAGVLANEGISAQAVSKGQAVHPDWEYRVESTEPAAGTEVTLKEAVVIVSCFEDLNIPAFLATVDCSSIPDSTPVYDRASRRALCDCLNGLIFNPSRTRCINCQVYLNGFYGAFNAGDLDNAQAWINEALSCDWAQQAQAQLNAERQRIACLQINANLQAACQQNNAPWASSALNDARAWSCNLDPGLVQYAINLINNYNAQVQQQQQAQQQAQQQQMQQFLGTFSDAMNQIYRNNQGGGSSGTTTGGVTGGSATPGITTSPSTSGSSGGSTQGSSGSNCNGAVDLLGNCAPEVKSEWRPGY